MQSVSSGQFWKLGRFPVTGQVFAQPLIVPNVSFKMAKTNKPIKVTLLLVATEENHVTAFDADDPIRFPATIPAPLWDIQVGAPVFYAFMPMGWSTKTCLTDLICWPNQNPPDQAVLIKSGVHRNERGYYNIFPWIGITSTPVIDTASLTIYVVAKTTEVDGSFAFRLHALDLRKGYERPNSPVVIAGSVDGRALNAIFPGKIAFNPKMQHQRPGLLLANGSVYIAFGSHQDTPPWHGWVFRYDKSTLKRLGVWCATCDGGGGGSIWQAGNGLAADESGSIYLMTGNGSSPPTNFAQSFVKLAPDLSYEGVFTPDDALQKSKDDIDLGSAGPVLLPGVNIVAGAGKDGRLFVIDRNVMTLRQVFQATKPEDGFSVRGTGFHHVHGSPVVWRDGVGRLLLYIWPERDHMYSYALSGDVFLEKPVSKSTLETPSSDFSTDSKMPGGMLSLSANGNAPGSAVLWTSSPRANDALEDTVGGVVRAFDATDVTKELWNSDQNAARDSVGLFAKYVPPTIANGRVYAATFSNAVYVYGLHQWASFVRQTAPPVMLQPGQTFTTDLVLRNTGATTWTSSQHYNLGSASPRDAMTWGINRQPLPIEQVPPGDSATFTLNLHAPTAEGTYSYQWRMVQDGVEWFGEPTPFLQVVVAIPGCEAARYDIQQAQLQLQSLEEQQGSLDPKRDQKAIAQIASLITKAQGRLTAALKEGKNLGCSVA